MTTNLRGGKEGRVIRCNSCGVVRRCDLSVEEIRAFHRDNLQVEQLNEEFERFRKENTDQQMVDTRRRVAKVGPGLVGGESVLDIGTGLGFFLDEIDPYVEETVGTEISRARRKYIEMNSNHTIFEDSPSILHKYGEGHFDLITLFHVLEHFPKPKKQLNDIYRLLSEDGRLVIEIPNHGDWLPDISEDYSQFYYQPAHVFYFTEGTLVDLLERAGFNTEVEYIQRYGLENARHWLEQGEPQINDPDMIADEDAGEMDLAYANVLRELGLTDTLWAIASK